MAHVARLRIFPVKSLDGVDVEAASITPGGGLEGDRSFALFGPDGDPITGKRTDRVHQLRTAYDPPTATLRVRDPTSDEPRSFDLDEKVQAAEAWFTDYFDQPVTIRRDDDRGFADRPSAGPSVVSTATLETVASWFDELTVEGVRRRLRANIEVADVPAFWEDRFVGDGAPSFTVEGPDGAVRIEGVEPCGRCVVPSRDPDTGEPLEGFRERFIERRAATFPAWADRGAFPHDYTLMLIARVPEADRGQRLHVGATVEIVDG
jgi:uncharacterized protein YcbX